MRYRARVEYDGTDFAGFQLKPGRRTVQGELEAALARLNRGARVRVDGAGRTDAGVHALDQVIAFTWTGRLADDGARSGTRGQPAAGRRDPRPAARAGRFHPRFAARYREYRYTVWNGPRSPLRERFALGVRVPLDTAAMARAGSALVGRHDFSAFGVADRQPVRTLHWVRVRRAGSLVTIDVAADAFLRQMVRRIVAVLLEVGPGDAGRAGGCRGAGLAPAGPERSRRSRQGAVPAAGRPRPAGRRSSGGRQSDTKRNRIGKKQEP